MNEFLQQLINGISLGAVYALIALGYTMVYGVLRFINFAHGDVFMVGAFAAMYSHSFIKRSGLLLPDWLIAGVVLTFSMGVGAVLGILIEKLAYKPLRERPRLTVLITAIGVSLLLEYLGQLFFGAAPRGFPSLVESRSFGGGGASFEQCTNDGGFREWGSADGFACNCYVYAHGVGDEGALVKSDCGSTHGG